MVWFALLRLGDELVSEDPGVLVGGTSLMATLPFQCLSAAWAITSSGTWPTVLRFIASFVRNRPVA